MRVRRLYFLALMACVRGAGAPPVTPIDVGQASAPPPGDVPPAKGSCLIKGPKTTLDLQVRAGDETLDLRIVELPTESELLRDGDGHGALVHVRSDIEFDGRIALATAPDQDARSLHTNGPLVLLGGLVKLGDTEVFQAQRVDDAALGVVMLGGYEIEDLPIPCDKLRIDERPTSWPVQLSTNDGTWVKGRSEVVSICSTPSGGPPCVRAKGMTFEELRRLGPTVEVRAEFDHGSEIRGWARADALMTTDEPQHDGYGASGGCGCGRRMLSHLRVGKPDPREHYGKATLRAGATIYATAELKGAWAKAAKDVEIDIEMRGADDHARVRDLPGVSTTVGCTCPGMDDHAFVKRESVVPIR